MRACGGQDWCSRLCQDRLDEGNNSLLLEAVISRAGCRLSLLRPSASRRLLLASCLLLRGRML
jgi:hypothetical protein